LATEIKATGYVAILCDIHHRK